MKQNRLISHLLSIQIFCSCFWACNIPQKENQLNGLQARYTFAENKLKSPDDDYEIKYTAVAFRNTSHYPTTTVGFSTTISILEQLDKQKKLREKGKEILSFLKNNDYLYADRNLSKITPEGSTTIQTLVNKYIEHIPYEDSIQLILSSDYTKPSTASLDEVETLTSVYDRINLEQREVMRVFNPIYDFTSLNIAYQEYLHRGVWKGLYEHYLDSVLVHNRILKDIVDIQNTPLEQQRTLASEMYESLSFLSNVNPSFDLYQYFSHQTWYTLWDVENVKDYLMYGPNTYSDGLTSTISFALLRDQLLAVDHALEERKTAMELRFMTYETFIMLHNILEISPVDSTDNNLSLVKNIWRNFEVAPFTANIAWLIYTKDKDDTLIQVLHNGAPAKLPLKPYETDYYKWSDFHRYYQAKIDSLHLEPSLSLKNQVKYLND